MAINLWDKHRLEMDMKRARWSMEVRASASAKYSILPERRFDQCGREYTVWNVYAVDYTRNARDPGYGTPVLMNTQCPFYSYGEAKAYAKEVFVDRKLIYFRGAPAQLIEGRKFKLTAPRSERDKKKK